MGGIVMGVVSLNGFKTEPGRLADHLAASMEALGLLRGLGARAVVLQALEGGDVGTIATSINYDDNAEYAASMQKIQGDAKWQEFWARAAAGASAMQVESSLFTDVDPSFQPDPERPMGAVMATQWRAKPGRMADFVGKVIESHEHVRRMGGTPRALQSVIGAHPMTMLVAVTFEDLDGWGAYADKTASDAGWQEFWAGAMSDPTADMIRSGLYVNISGD
jgi:hypothetical protein